MTISSGRSKFGSCEKPFEDLDVDVNELLNE
jgi:hypothetical protein